MIYLLRHRDTAVCETEARAQALEAQGYIRCSRAAFCEAWQKRDVAALAKMRDALPDVERVVGQVAELPNGYRLYKA